MWNSDTMRRSLTIFSFSTGISKTHLSLESISSSGLASFHWGKQTKTFMAINKRFLYSLQNLWTELWADQWKQRQRCFQVYMKRWWQSWLNMMFYFWLPFLVVGRCLDVDVSSFAFRKQLLHVFPPMAATESLQLQTPRSSISVSVSRMLHIGCLIACSDYHPLDCYWGNLHHSSWNLFETTVKINLPVRRIESCLFCAPYDLTSKGPARSF